MQGNYRQHYLAAATRQATAQAQSRFTQVSMAAASNDCNGLPTSTPTHHQQHQQQHQVARQPQAELQRSSQQANHVQSRPASNSSCLDQQQKHAKQRTSASDFFRNPVNLIASYWPQSNSSSSSSSSNGDGTNRKLANQNQIASNNNNNILKKSNPICEQQQQQQYHQKTHADQDEQARRAALNEAQNSYASQIRSSQLQYGNRVQYQQQQQQQQQPIRMYPSTTNAATSSKSDKSTTSGNQASNQRLGHETTTSSRTSGEGEQSRHVNFNRTGRAPGAASKQQPLDNDDDDDGEEGSGSRKKKYLTAKYGQQQMNLIKKRLKIEMWLYEQLKELTKDSKSEAELDEIDIDLDELLDMEDDSTRRHWLQKTLEPFEDVDARRINEFIDQVLEQSRLL